MSFDDSNDNNGFRPSNIIIIVFVLAALGLLVAAGVQTLNDVTEEEAPRAEVFCHIGSEKDDLMANPEVQRILLEDYGLDVTTNNMGSIEQARLSTGELAGVDCLWPSNTSALEIFAEQNSDLSFSDSIIFNSPIVLYTWRSVLEGLERGGVVTQADEGHYVADTAEMVALLAGDERPTWNELGVNAGLSGRFNITTTNPTTSNSGNMFYGLLLNMLNEGEVASINDFEVHQDTIADYFERQGLQIDSSGTLFDNYIVQGMGAVPLMANYESLIIEFSIANATSLDQIQDTLRIIYPQPTVYSSHPMIALTEGGERLLAAMQDDTIQQIAWEQHGFRSGVLGIDNDPAVLDVAGIPQTVTAVIPLPRSQAMLEMVETLDGL